MAFNYKTEYERYRRYYQSLEPILKKPKSRTYSMAIFSFLAISLFGWYGIRPTIQTILFLRREIADNQIVNSQMEDKITRLVEAQAAYQNASDRLPLLEQAIPQDPDIINVVSQIKNLANTTNSSLSAIQVPTIPLLPSQATVSGTAAQAKLTEIPLVIAVSGTYTNIKAFLDGIISMRRLFTITTIGLSPSKEELKGNIATGSGTLLRMVIRTNAYYMPLKKN